MTLTQIEPTRTHKARAWYIVFMNALVGCSIASTFPQFSMTVGELALKSGISESILLTSDTIKSCGIVIAMLISGFMYNKFGARLLFIYATLIAVIPQVLFIHIDQIWLLMILKFLQGTSSIIFPVFLVIIMNWTEEKNTGLATAIFNGIFYGGGGIGGTFAGIIIARSSWEMSFYAMAAVQIFIGIIWMLTVKEKPTIGGLKVRISTKSDCVPTLDEKYLNDEATNNVPSSEYKPKGNLLATSKIWLLSISFLATTWSVQAITVDMPLFSGALGFGDLETGKILTAVTIGMIVSCLVSGKVSDFYAVRSKRKDIARLTVFIFGYFIVAAAVLFIILFDMSNFFTLYIAALLFTFGASWGLGTFYCVLPEIYDEDTVPIVTGITGGIGDAGMPIAPLVVGVAFGIRGMWEIGWASCAVMAALSTLSAIILMRMLKKSKTS